MCEGGAAVPRRTCLIRIGLATVSLAALIACAPSANIAKPPTPQAEVARQALQYAASRGPVLAEVVGEPLDRPGRVEEVLRAADRGVQGLDVAFTTDPALAPQPELKLVMVVNPARPFEPAAACVDPEVAQEPAEPNRPSLLAVFCEEGRPLAGALGDIEVSGPDDPRYDRLVHQTTAALFPDDYWDRWGGLPFSLGVGVGSGGRTSVGVGVGVGL